MKSYIVYDDLGAILQTGTCPESMLELQASAGRNVLEGTANQLTEYVVGGEIRPRPVLSPTFSKEVAVADGTDEITISTLPSGVEVRIAGPIRMSGTSDGTDVTLTFGLPGTYTVWLTLFPYQDMKAEIHAT